MAEVESETAVASTVPSRKLSSDVSDSESGIVPPPAKKVKTVSRPLWVRTTRP